MGQYGTKCPELPIQNLVLSESPGHNVGYAQNSSMSGASIVGSLLWATSLKRNEVEPGLQTVLHGDAGHNHMAPHHHCNSLRDRRKEILLFGRNSGSTSGVLLLPLLFYFPDREVTRVQTYNNLWEITHGLTIWWKLGKAKSEGLVTRRFGERVYKCTVGWPQGGWECSPKSVLVDEVLNNERNKMRVLRMSISLFPQSP